MKRNNTKKPLYLTKRILVSAARKGIKQAAKETLAVMGCNVIARDGWVVKYLKMEE